MSRQLPFSQLQLIAEDRERTWSKGTMTTYKLTYFGARARAELIRLIFVQAEVEFENERLPYYAGTAEWTAKKASKYTTTASISISQ